MMHNISEKRALSMARRGEIPGAFSERVRGKMFDRWYVPVDAKPVLAPLKRKTVSETREDGGPDAHSA